MVNRIERFINSFRGELWPDMSSIARYCDSPEDFLNLIEVLLKEIETGSLAIGVYGSRKDGTNIPESDIDILSVLPGKGIYIPTDIGRERLVKKSRYPESLFSAGYTKPWVEMNRISLHDVQHLSQRSFTTQTIVKETDFLWFKNRSAKNLICTSQLSLTHLSLSGNIA